MSGPASRIDLPAELVEWAEAAAGAPLANASPHYAGASRAAWNLEVATAAGRRALFLLRDKGQGGGSARDAAVLRALRDTPIPVPEVFGESPEHAAILLERLPGRSDFPAVDHEWEREPTARHLMELTGLLHSLDVGQLDIAHLELPKAPEDCARRSLEQTRAAERALGAAADPFFGFALDWLEANIPTAVSRYSLVHSDMGPGNFLHQGGRITGIVDWEVAHFGDPMEDLAAIAVRDMATPVGALAVRLREYEESSGIPIDLARVDYYRALVLVRNSLMIGLGLAHPAAGFDVDEMTMYQTLLVRAAALVLCDNLGIPRPTAADSLPARAFETPDDEAELANAVDACERREAEELLSSASGGAPALDETLDDALRSTLASPPTTPGWRERAARYFARRMLRLAFRRRRLLGPLYERLPQPLEEP